MRIRKTAVRNDGSDMMATDAAAAILPAALLQAASIERGTETARAIVMDITARESVTGKRRMTISWISRPLAVIPQSPLMKAERNDA